MIDALERAGCDEPGGHGRAPRGRAGRHHGHRPYTYNTVQGDITFDANGDTSQLIVSIYSFDAAGGTWKFESRSTTPVASHCSQRGRGSQGPRPHCIRLNSRAAVTPPNVQADASARQVTRAEGPDQLEEQPVTTIAVARPRALNRFLRIAVIAVAAIVGYLFLLHLPAHAVMARRERTDVRAGVSRRGRSRPSTPCRSASIYALIALGYTMVYGIIELINFAHGDVFMVGAFASLFMILAVFGQKNGTPVFDVPFLIVILAVTLRGRDAVDRAAQPDDRAGLLSPVPACLAARPADHRGRRVVHPPERRAGDRRRRRPRPSPDLPAGVARSRSGRRRSPSFRS